MIDALLELPPNVRERIAKGLASGLLPLRATPAALCSIIGRIDEGSRVAEALAAFAELGVNAAAASRWIRSLDQAQSRTRAPELVWTGPDVPGVHARDTRQVFEELLGSVQRSAWVCTYAYFDGPRAFESLARRMDAKRDLQVTLLMNIERRKGDTASPEDLVRRFADKFWSRDWPGTQRPAVFFDARSLDDGRPSGVLHAKAVVVDEEAVFLTSANFTEAAWDRNIELGVLIRDNALATSLSSHFRLLIEQDVLSPLPTS